MRKLHAVGIIALSLCLVASAALAADGIVRAIFPPGNIGDRHGAGEIEETDGPGGTPLGRPYLIFQIPQDVSAGPVCDGTQVSFIADDQGQRAISVEAIAGPCVPCIPPDCTGGI